jgi:magnesium transporter
MTTSFRLLSEAFLTAHPEKAAAAIEELELAEAASFLSEASPEAVARVLERMVATHAAECFAAMPVETGAAVLAHVNLYAAASVMRAMEPAAREPLLAGADADVSMALRLLLASPEGTAGALMDPRVKAMPADIDVAEALRRLRSSPGRVLDYIYLVDRDGVLVGVLDMRELMNAPAAQPVIAAAHRRVSRFSAHATRETIVSHPRWRDVHALPVTDDAGRLLGVIRYGTFRRLEEEDMIERRHHHPSALVMSFVGLYWLAIVELLPVLGDVFLRLVAPARGRVGLGQRTRP